MDDSATIERLLDERLRVTQIVAAALMLGVLFFAGVVMFGPLANQPPRAANAVPMLSYGAAGLFAVILLVWAVLPGRMAEIQVGKIARGQWNIVANPATPAGYFATDTAKLLATYQTKVIVACALLEGSAFASIVAYMIERQTLALAIAASAVLLMAATFPIRTRVRRWLDGRLTRMDELRQFGDDR